MAVVDEPAEEPEVVAGGGSGAASGGGEVVADKKPIDPRVLEALRVAWTVDLSNLKTNRVPSAAIFIADDDRLAFSFEDEFRAALEAPEWDGWRSFVVDEFVLDRPDGQQIIVGPVRCKNGEDPIAGRSLVFFAIDVSVPKSGYDTAQLLADARRQRLRGGSEWSNSDADLEVFRSAEQAFALKQAKAEKAALSPPDEYGYTDGLAVDDIVKVSANHFLHAGKAGRIAQFGSHGQTVLIDTSAKGMVRTIEVERIFVEKV